ncbi:MAG: hypothetical protein J6K29_07835 [Clostridia bacterium]|nr:hypothetical protein [Clostridia bacterium]
MKNSAMHPKNGHKLGFLLRILTMFWAILGPVAVIAAAVVSTVLEGDWWSELFYMYLALYTLLGFTTYFSLLTILWEAARRTGRQAGEDLRDTPFTAVLHRILRITAVAGLVTVAFILLIFFDLLNGGFAMIHFAIGILQVSLYAVCGIHAVIRRITDRRRAEKQRLAEEKQAWEGYLT